jgi:hypothetical protein
MRAKILNLAGAERLLEEVAWTLGSHGDVKREADTIILGGGSRITLGASLIKDAFWVESWVEPNMLGLQRIPVHLYPRNLVLNTIEELKSLLIDIALEVKRSMYIIATLVSMGLLNNQKYVGIVINIDKEEDRFRPTSRKVIVNVGGIGYEISFVGGRTAYRITLPSFKLFKAFVEVIIPEFLESRGEERE